MRITLRHVAGVCLFGPALFFAACQSQTPRLPPVDPIPAILELKGPTPFRCSYEAVHSLGGPEGITVGIAGRSVAFTRLYRFESNSSSRYNIEVPSSGSFTFGVEVAVRSQGGGCLSCINACSGRGGKPIFKATAPGIGNRTPNFKWVVTLGFHGCAC